MDIPTWLSELVAGATAFILTAGGASALTVWLVRKVSINWLDGRFAKNLEDFKHKQQVELQRLRLEIDALLSGAIKLQEREFEILPELWTRFDEATRQARSLISPFRQAENYSQVTDEGLVEILENRNIPQYKILEVLSQPAAHRQATIRQWDFEKELHDARVAYQHLQDTASRFAIFLSPTLQGLLKKCMFELGLLLNTKQFNRGQSGEFTVTMTMFEEKIEPIKKSVETEISKRLRGHGIREEVSVKVTLQEPSGEDLTAR